MDDVRIEGEKELKKPIEKEKAIKSEEINAEPPKSEIKPELKPSEPPKSVPVEKPKA
jgi:hypothetical protein